MATSLLKELRQSCQLFSQTHARKGRSGKSKALRFSFHAQAILAQCSNPTLFDSNDAIKEPNSQNTGELEDKA